MCVYGYNVEQTGRQSGKVANPARGQLNREMNFTCARSSLRIWSRETSYSAVPYRL